MTRPPTPETLAHRANPATVAAAHSAPAVTAPVATSGAGSLVRSLEALGVEVAFGIPGGAILPAYDPLYDSKVRHILVRHEQGAGHAATGYAQATGKVGVCIATSGPGATNLVTPIADAYMDSGPIVAITGQVPRPAIGTDAFQEADIQGITLPITKHNYLVKSGEELPRVLAEAFHLASTGRPGPVLVDLPKDILQAHGSFSWPPQLDLPGYHPTTKPHAKQIREAARMIAGAKLSSLPVTRSSKRAPRQISRSLFCSAVTAVTVPCMPGMPRCCGWLSGNAPRAMRVVTTGMPVSSASTRSSAAARALSTPPPT